MANWLVETDTKVIIRGVKDETGAFVNDATLTGDLYFGTGQAAAPVTGAQDLVFTYIDGSDGDYQGVVPHDAQILEGLNYDLFLTAVREGQQMVIRVRRQAKYLEA